ncbi:hypothetical protein HIM_01375 [Hirsutella minnesotensis 3608]|nr:hypothetical protein HIM_01375 [Hirsutella minnesotensis 3608]
MVEAHGDGCCAEQTIEAVEAAPKRTVHQRSSSSTSQAASSVSSGPDANRREDHEQRIDSEQSDASTPAKRLKMVPRNAPGSIEKVGRYTFRHGVRISDYRLPSPRASMPTTADAPSYQCRDGFEGDENSPPRPWLLKRTRGQDAEGHPGMAEYYSTREREPRLVAHASLGTYLYIQNVQYHT